MLTEALLLALSAALLALVLVKIARE